MYKYGAAAPLIIVGLLLMCEKNSTFVPYFMKK